MKIYKISHTIEEYSAYKGHVIVANSEVEVREIAKKGCGGEGIEVWATAEIEECGIYTGQKTEPFTLLSDFNDG